MEDDIEYDEDKVVCTTCGVPLFKNNMEYHHFPVSEKNGGTDTIPLCKSCHNLIERIPVDRWPLSFISEVMTEFKESRWAMLMVFKLVRLHDLNERMTTSTEAESFIDREPEEFDGFVC